MGTLRGTGGVHGVVMTLWKTPIKEEPQEEAAEREDDSAEGKIEANKVSSFSDVAGREAWHTVYEMPGETAAAGEEAAVGDSAEQGGCASGEEMTAIRHWRLRLRLQRTF